jgi:putative tryptophan/tyrosine transport system substrate-binding protein
LPAGRREIGQGANQHAVWELDPNADANNASIEIQAKQTQAAADKFGMNFKILRASNPTDIDAVFTTFSQRSSTGLLVNSDPFLTGRRSQIVALAARYAIPAIYPWREYVLEGGLMSYGSSNIESYRMAGVYVGRILNGAQPKELPIMQPTIFELAINLKTARALGMSVSSAILARADEVIE